MPEYPSAQALLSDARLRLDSLGESVGILILEGHDDQRLFTPRAANSQQLVVTGGRTLLLSAHSSCSPADLESMLFVTDCDFEVTLGRLSPLPSLIITKNADVEADFLELGMVERLVIETVPAALESAEMARSISQSVLDRALAFAEVLGQLRRVAISAGAEIDLEDVKYRKNRVKGSHEVNEPQLISRIGQQLDFCGMRPDEFSSSVQAQVRGYKFTHGKDLLNAIQFVLREDFNTAIESDVLARLLRMGSADYFESWSVTSRIRRWEASTGRRVLT